MKTVKVELGGQEYEIQPLPIKPSSEWRKKMGGPFGELTRVLKRIPKVEVDDMGGISQVIRTVSDTLIESPDTVRDLLFAYSPVLQADRERIEEEGYDDEVMVAFVEVIKLAYPFSELRRLISGNGRGSRQTTKKSPSPSGASAKKS